MRLLGRALKRDEVAGSFLAFGYRLLAVPLLYWLIFYDHRVAERRGTGPTPVAAQTKK